MEESHYSIVRQNRIKPYKSDTKVEDINAEKYV